MRKNIIIALAALMTVAVSCRKTSIEKTDNVGADPNPAVVLEQSPDITRIIKFNNDVVLRRENPGLKTREVITLDEAKDNIADLFNAVYGEPTEYYGETEHAEFSVTLPVDADGNVLLDDAVAAYEEAVGLARESYHASTLENKGYICMSATVEEQRGGTAEVKLNGVFGKKTAAPTAAEGYFDKYESWPYKFHADGDCEPSINYMGADDTLQTVMKSILIPNNTMSPKDYRIITYGVKNFDFNGRDYQSRLFYSDDVNETCIYGVDMNRYLDNGMDIIMNEIPDSLGFHCDRGGIKVYKVVSLTVDGNGNADNYGSISYITHRYEGKYGLQDYMLVNAIQQNEL